MSKYKHGFMSDIEKEKEQEERQDELHEKYPVDPNVLIVEKPSAYTFTVKLILNGIRLFAMIVLCVFAAIGVIALLYPAPRAELEIILLQVVDTIRGVAI